MKKVFSGMFILGFLMIATSVCWAKDNAAKKEVTLEACKTMGVPCDRDPQEMKVNSVVNTPNQVIVVLFCHNIYVYNKKTKRLKEAVASPDPEYRP